MLSGGSDRPQNAFEQKRVNILNNVFAAFVVGKDKLLLLF